MAAKDMAAATKNVLKDAGNLFSDTAHEAVSAAVDTAHIAIHSMKTKKDDLFEADTKKAGDVTEDEFLDDDYVDDDDLYDYARLDRSADEDNGISVSVNADASEELTKEEAEEDAASDAAADEEAGKTAEAVAEPVKETATIEEDTL